MSGTPTNVVAGPGWLYVAPIATADPTDATTPLGSAWVPVGYTEEGSTFSYAIKREDLVVDEEVDPIKSYTTQRDTTIKFSMAEATAENLLLALNGGVVNNPADVSAPDYNAEVYIKIVLQAIETGARWVFRKCMQMGTVEVVHRKAPAKTLIPVEFKLYVPSGGGDLFVVYPSAAGLV